MMSGEARHQRHQPVEEGWTGPFHFLALADPQLGTLHSNEAWDEELEMLRKAIAHANRLKPAFVVFLGDLVHAFPDQSEELKQIQTQQVEDFRTALAEMDSNIPIYYVSGNHDLGNKLTHNALQLYRQRFGPDFFEFTCRGVRGVVLNTQAFDDPDATELAEEQIRFLQSALEIEDDNGDDDGDDDDDSAQDQEGRRGDASKKSRGAERDTRPRIVQKIVFGHIPPFLFEEDEPDGYFNIAPEMRARLLGIAKKAGVRLWMSGHYHRNAVGRAGELEAVTTSAVGTTLHPSGIDPLGLKGFDDFQCGEQHSGFRVVRVYEDRIEHDWYTMANVPQSIAL
ncbi:CSTP1 protein [Salpingoeca rosetta]|uniref:CSTP1 protein n=1 Tax=Salpingoeca rosetta (strain ATCC 50818 / BSB-021) TaxID=946362 RepID=F2UQW1_SALR5|nr:CSTP1 protein [Salpingoeca rosetta]EGD80016.1 CSTP1 protein [Salpingoeca rosetta]|eukprot:XP_004988341.1 CSTP1 protein [Salpingoeca rosetta]